jgi:hypothetical protein
MSPRELSGGVSVQRLALMKSGFSTKGSGFPEGELGTVGGEAAGHAAATWLAGSVGSTMARTRAIPAGVMR